MKTIHGTMGYIEAEQWHTGDDDYPLSVVSNDGNSLYFRGPRV